jgi:DNA repair protein RecO (recombination protein O)
MAMKHAETRGLVFFSRHYRERDLLVKIFTESFGKRMFFVKNASKSRLNAALQNFTTAFFSTTINDDGFCFLNDVSEVQNFQHLSEDIFANAHASVVIALADEAVADAVYDPALYAFLVQTLQLMNDSVDQEILTNIFELQVLSRFGVQLNLSECAICARRDLPMDFSFAYDGCLCREHFSKDPRRLHLDPNVLFLAGQFLEISLEKLQKISVSADRKMQLRQFIDALYEDYVGVRTKAKKFLDEMDGWAGLMK